MKPESNSQQREEFYREDPAKRTQFQLFQREYKRRSGIMRAIL